MVIDFDAIDVSQFLEAVSFPSKPTYINENSAFFKEGCPLSDKLASDLGSGSL